MYGKIFASIRSKVRSEATTKTCRMGAKSAPVDRVINSLIEQRCEESSEPCATHYGR